MDLRNRYKTLLPKSGYYRQSNMKLMASSVNRCIQSLSSFMAGFLPPPDSDNTLPIKWQSMPFIVDNDGRILKFDTSSCPRYLRDMMAGNAAINTSPTTRSWLSQDKAVLSRVGDFLGQPLTDFTSAAMAGEVIRTNQFLDPSTPLWTLSAYEATLKKYLMRMFDIYHETDFMKQIRGGPMITEVLDNFAAIRDNNSTGRNIVVFSAHDLTLHSMIMLLNVKLQVPTVASYGDAVAIELHQTGSGQPEVQVYYFGSAGKLKFKILLHVPNCGTPCRLTTFNSLMSKYIIRDFDGICRL